MEKKHSIQDANNERDNKKYVAFECCCWCATIKYHGAHCVKMCFFFCCCCCRRRWTVENHRQHANV